jgi:DNA-binding MarR family transcriptional regulator
MVDFSSDRNLAGSHASIHEPCFTRVAHSGKLNTFERILPLQADAQPTIGESRDPRDVAGPIADKVPETAERSVTLAIEDRKRRGTIFPAELFADPAWDILLELYRAELRQCRVPVSRLCTASQVPATTALRWLNTLEAEGLLARGADPFDRRRVYIRLTSTGSMAMAWYFERTMCAKGEEQCD